VLAFDGLAATDSARLYLVGSVLEAHPEGAVHRDDLRRLADGRAGVELREGYVSDEDFDVWLQAADTLLLPYRTIASSGVVARARVLGTPVVVTDVGALPEQAGPDGIVVRDDAELRAAMVARVHATPPRP
jgi:glycosyltransferase involved in cell wall biosynthesis